MARFTVSPSGAVDDFVRLDLGGQRCAIVLAYEVKAGVFTQPAAFSVTIGSGETAASLARRFPALTPYALFVGDVLQQTGRTDGYTTSDGTGATTLQIRGRDQLAPLLDTDAESDRSFSGMSWTQIVTELLSLAGIDDFTLFGDNAANRSASSGSPIGGQPSVAALRSVAVAAELRRIKTSLDEQTAKLKGTAGATLAIVSPGKPTQIIRQGVTAVETPNAVPDPVPPAPAQDKPLKIRAGENLYSWLKAHIGHAGLFLWSGVDANTFILAQPNTAQKPIARLIRQRGGAAGANGVNVLSVRHKNETTGRATRYVVHGRGGRGAAGRGSLRGEYIDEEMLALGFPLSRVKVVESDVKSDKQAAYEARRLCAAARREGWEYNVTVQGHSAPSLARPGERVVWTPDTMIEVLDDELGIYENLWASDDAYRRGADGTTTEITLHRAGDLVFAEAEYV